jgi:hypothetical protein
MNTANCLNKTSTLLFGLFWLTFCINIRAADELNPPPREITAAPVLSRIESADLIYEKASGTANITSSITITDSDSKNLRSAAVRITEGYHAGEDVLGFINQSGINGFWNKSTGVLTLTGNSSVSNYQKALRSIQYENINIINPSADTRKVTFTVNDGLSASNTVSRNIVIIIPDLAPVLGRMENSQIIYCINSGPVQVTSSLTVSDGDDDNISSAKIQITGKYKVAEDILRFTDRNGITGAWDASGGILTLTGQASKADYQAALRSITYENTNSENPETGIHTITFTVSDGKVFGNQVSRGIYVNGPVTAVLSGNATQCSDQLTEMPLRIEFKGTPPWKFTLTRDNANEKNYDLINQNPYIFNVNNPGTYRVKTLSDVNCAGDTTGSGAVKIMLNTPPTAILSGNDTICQGAAAELSVVFTGKAPWSITYLRDGSNSTVISNIYTANYILKVTSSGTYTLAGVTDAVCTNGKGSGTAIVKQLAAPTALLSGDASICENTSATLTVSLTGIAPWQFSYKKDNGTPVAIQDVNTSPRTLSVSDPGNYTLFEVYDKFCKGTVSGSARISVMPTPDVSISGLASNYNKDSSETVLLTGTPAGGTFSGPGVIPYNNAWYFFTSLAPVGTHQIVYAYRESPTSCYGYDTVIVRVLEASATIDFPENRLAVCLNEGAFTIKAVNLDNSIGEFKISGGAGLTDNRDNTATIDPHILGPGDFTVTYSYLDGRVFSVKKSFQIGAAPTADFKWDTECFDPGQSIAFENTSTNTFGNLSQFLWTVKTDARTDTFKTENIEYAFPDEGKYDVRLNVETSNGCTDGVVKKIGLSTPIKLAGQTYFEDFEDSAVYWHTNNDPSKPINSWVLSDTTKGFKHTKSGHLFWHTNIPNEKAPKENSWVTSPCFDFSGTEKPMVILDIWKRFNALRDGAALQASADSGKSWISIGELNDGINWYNSTDILGEPGGQDYGWANIQDYDWRESRHDLDILKGKSRIQFRMAYGSDGTALNTDGLAFDNFRIKERNQKALLEHFTNSADPVSRIADSTLNNMILSDTADLVDLQYHTSFPGADPFNALDPYIPGARLFYYGVQKVPYTILNGGIESALRFDYSGKPLKWGTLRVESLSDAKFAIRLYSQLIDNNTIIVNTWITALRDMPSNEYTVHVGVVERKITGETGANGETVFQDVVKTLLPDAAGNSFFRSWNANEVDSVRNFWYVHDVYDASELEVFAFIQDESTSEVYQAALENFNLVTASKDYFPSENPLMVYPNPADNQVIVKLNKPVSEPVLINIYNGLGALVRSVEIPDKATETRIATTLLPDGMYILRAVSGTSVLGTQKLNVNH